MIAATTRSSLPGTTGIVLVARGAARAAARGGRRGGLAHGWRERSTRTPARPVADFEPEFRRAVAADRERLHAIHDRLAALDA